MWFLFRVFLEVIVVWRGIWGYKLCCSVYCIRVEIGVR